METPAHGIGGLDDVLMPDSYAKRIYGYSVRQALPSEHSFFFKNKNVGGMAADDGSIVLNPYTALSPAEQSAVARNEAARLYMRQKGYTLGFALTPQQKQTFAGTVYGDPANAEAARASIIARALSGDPSAGTLTPEQQTWAARIGSELQGR